MEQLNKIIDGMLQPGKLVDIIEAPRLMPHTNSHFLRINGLIYPTDRPFHIPEISGIAQIINRSKRFRKNG